LSFDLFKESSGPLLSGARTIGTSIAQISGFAPNGGLKKGIAIKASADNEGRVYIGRNNVTTTANEQTGGFPLAASESIVIPTESLTSVYAIADQADQVIHWLAI